MNRCISLCSLIWLALASTGCLSIVGDFTVGTESDGAADDATVLPEAGSLHDGTTSHEGSSSAGASGPETAGDARSPGDAGAPSDASVDGALDDGTNGATCVPGGSCSPGDCQNGTWVCVDGGRTCQATTAFDSGTPCGADGDAGASVCNAGQCVACNAGGDCSDPSAKCVKKTYDCSSGTAICTVSGNVPDGTSCGTGAPMYCNGGTCTACQVGTSCQPAANGCHVGKITACTGGIATCTDKGAAALAGTPCSAAGGASGVCDSNGSCAACSTGAQCNPNGDSCQVGVQSCSTGPHCTNPVDVHEGQTCGTGLVCHNGTCATCDSASCYAGCCDSHGCVTTAQTDTECGTGTGGAACTSCAGPSAGTGSPSCSANACMLACSGATPNACNGACTNFKTDDNNCGSCGHACGQGSQCNGAGACSCVPTTTCKALGDNCGSFVDECKVTQTCGSCTAPDVCTTAANGAGKCACKATDSCSTHGFACGAFTDSCGNMPNCGTCVAPKTCSGANGAGGACSCTPKTTCASLHATCGSFVDDCGNSQNCGTCASGSGTCSGAPGTCGGCNTAACGTSKCGSASEGANCPTANCGSCPSGQICNSTSGPGACVCASGTTSCNGGCVSTGSDPNNCGFCGNRCGSGLRCLNGMCTCDVTSCSGCCSGNTCGAKLLWYPDNDGDGYGDEGATGVASCAKPVPIPFQVTAWVTDNTDCCDQDPVTNPGYLAANAANPWKIVPNGCGNFLYNCEPSGVPVMQFSAAQCSTAWHNCGNAGSSAGNPVSCAASGCSAVCSASGTSCPEYAQPTACGQSTIENYYNCTTIGTDLCMAGIGMTQSGPEGCY